MLQVVFVIIRSVAFLSYEYSFHMDWVHLAYHLIFKFKLTHIIVLGREIYFRVNLFQSSLEIAIFRLYWTKTHLQTIVDVHSPRLVLYEVRLWLWLQWLVAISILAVWRLESVLQLGKWKKSLMVLLDYNGKMVITDLQWRHLPLHSIQNNIGMVDMTLWNNMDLHNMLPPNFESFFW